MKSFMSTHEFLLLFKDKMPDLATYAKNGFIDKSKDKAIGIFLGPSRSPLSLSIGGIDNTIDGTLPVNIVVHWTESYSECEAIAKSIQMAFYGLSDVKFGKRRIAGVKVLDPTPIDVGRSEKNYCEMVVRLDAVYYLEEETV